MEAGAGPTGARAALIAAGLRLFGESGYEGTSTCVLAISDLIVGHLRALLQQKGTS